MMRKDLDDRSLPTVMAKFNFLGSDESPDRDLSTDKREAILAGAMQEFLEHGYAGARVDRLVKAAGVSKATVYRHFPDKEALFVALIQKWRLGRSYSVSKTFILTSRNLPNFSSNTHWG